VKGKAKAINEGILSGTYVRSRGKEEDKHGQHSTWVTFYQRPHLLESFRCSARSPDDQGPEAMCDEKSLARKLDEVITDGTRTGKIEDE
jgi:hypothetical protein